MPFLKGRHFLPFPPPLSKFQENSSRAARWPAWRRGGTAASRHKVKWLCHLNVSYPMPNLSQRKYSNLICDPEKFPIPVPIPAGLGSPEKFTRLRQGSRIRTEVLISPTHFSPQEIIVPQK